MEWNAKWDWENLVMFNSKTIGSPKKQPISWGIGAEGEFDTGSFNLSEGGCGGSSSELVHGSSVSVSASTDTSSKEALKPTMISFEAFQGADGGGFSKKNGLASADVYETSPVEASVGSGEPLIGLKLGKRTYFENHGSAGITKASPFSMVPVSSSSSAVAATKKIKPSSQITTSVRCQVEGCNLDLSSAKDYHRKHRVCESHSKCPKVIINGFERRFCQQCSRFHSLSEFDEKKKSCRRRLNDHNARRRKPQPQAHQFNPARLSASFLDGRQQMSFVLNNGPPVHSRSSSVSPMWETTYSSKFTITEGSPLKAEKVGGGAAQQQVSGSDMMHAIYTSGQNFNRLLPLKGTKTESFTQGLKEPMLSSSFDAAHDVHHALSLLSTNDTWGSEPANGASDNLIHVNLANMPPQPVIHRVPQGLPLISSENWQEAAENNGDDLRRLPSSAANDNGHYHEIQLFKTPPAYNNCLFF